MSQSYSVGQLMRQALTFDESSGSVWYHRSAALSNRDNEAGGFYLGLYRRVYFYLPSFDHRYMS